ncbi:hypothetical protein ABZP36_005872 [Zizania latifolia]
MLHEQHAPPPQQAGALHPSAPATDDAAGDEEGGTTFRDIHPLTTPTPPARLGSASWDTASHRSFSSEEQFMTMSREFTAMVAAGATMQTGADQLINIGEDELEETNPLAIVPDSHPIATPARSRAPLDLEVVPAGPATAAPQQPVDARQVKKEEVETKVSAWQTSEVAKIINRFKREEVVINGCETEQVEKASAWFKKIECMHLHSTVLQNGTWKDEFLFLMAQTAQRKMDEQRAKVVEKTQNDVAKARRRAEEKRATAEAKRGLKLAKVLELATFMKAVGRVPTRRSFF